MSEWDAFFAAEAGAAATLAGLLFVAVSINLARILEFPQLPARAAEALIVILSVLAIATCGLVPRQGLRPLGAEVVGIGVVVWTAVGLIQIGTFKKERHPEDRPIWHVVTGLLPAVPFVTGGVLLLRGCSSGLYWLVPGTLFSFAGGVANAWVLLIEIMR